MTPQDFLRNQLQLLCDTVLYAEAQNFLKEHRAPDNNQLNGLLAFSRNAKELGKYVSRQRERNWGEGYKGHYAVFYSALDRTLRNLKERVPLNDPMTGTKLSKLESEAARDILCREFVYHLIAHALFTAQQPDGFANR